MPGNGFKGSSQNILMELVDEGLPDDIKCKISLEMFLSGYSQALSDYRVLLAGRKREFTIFAPIFRIDCWAANESSFILRAAALAVQH